MWIAFLIFVIYPLTSLDIPKIVVIQDESVELNESLMINKCGPNNEWPKINHLKFNNTKIKKIRRGGSYRRKASTFFEQAIKNKKKNSWSKFINRSKRINSLKRSSGLQGDSQSYLSPNIGKKLKKYNTNNKPVSWSRKLTNSAFKKRKFNSKLLNEQNNIVS